MDIIALAFLLGRILVGGYFVFSGVMHFVQFKQMVGYASSKGVPMTTLAVFVASLLILLGGAGVLLGVYVTWALWALIIFMVSVTFFMHAFWKITDPNERRIARVQFLKNMTILGALLMLLVIPTPWPFALLP